MTPLIIVDFIFAAIISRISWHHGGACHRLDPVTPLSVDVLSSKILGLQTFL
jgi:hypothetical protein